MIEYLFALAGVMVMIRLISGPSFADRMISTGALINIIVTIIALESFKVGKDFYMDIAILMILLSLVGTLAIVRYMRDSDVF